MRRRDVYIIWLDYFDSTISRRSGRRVPLSIATKHPQLHELAEAARRLGLNVVRSVKASYPRRHRRVTGYIEVSRISNTSKQKLILMLAKALIEVKHGK